MTPEARAFRAEVIQRINEWTLDPHYQRVLEHGGATPGHAMHEWVMMQLAAVQLPQPPDDSDGNAVAHPLDDAALRALIRSQTEGFHPRDIYYHHDLLIDQIPTDGAIGSFAGNIRRQYHTIDRDGVLGWVYLPVPSKAQFDADQELEDPKYDADQVTMPDLTTAEQRRDGIWLHERYRSLGW